MAWGYTRGSSNCGRVQVAIDIAVVDCVLVPAHGGAVTYSELSAVAKEQCVRLHIRIRSSGKGSRLSWQEPRICIARGLYLWLKDPGIRHRAPLIRSFAPIHQEDTHGQISVDRTRNMFEVDLVIDEHAYALKPFVGPEIEWDVHHLRWHSLPPLRGTSTLCFPSALLALRWLLRVRVLRLRLLVHQALVVAPASAQEKSLDIR